MHKKTILGFLAIVTLLVMTGCQPTTSSQPKVIRVGYFANMTHSQALIGLVRGDFQQALGKDVEIKPTVFNAGPSVIEAMFASQIDLAYIGPNPSINGYVQSEGKALRIVAGATSAGVAFVVRPAANIHTAADLAGKKLATPQLGNTQDVALRSYLAANGLKTKEQGGDVEVDPMDNSQTLDLFKQGKIDGAWVPEPWASRLIVEGGGTLFLDERDLWTNTNSQFVTANIIVATKFLASNPDLVKTWLKAHVEITQWEIANPTDAQTIINDEIEKATGKKLAAAVLTQAWGRMTPTWDPISASLVKCAQSAFDAGFLKTKPDLTGIYDLTLLNQVLKEKGLAGVN